MILAATTSFGFLKSVSYKRRSEKLNSVCLSISQLAELVKTGGNELEYLIKNSFERDIIYYENGFQISNAYFKSQDIKLLTDFLDKIGMEGRESEYNRIKIYSLLFQKQLSEAQKEEEQSSKLCRSLGFLIGLSICIFLI